MEFVSPSEIFRVVDNLLGTLLKRVEFSGAHLIQQTQHHRHMLIADKVRALSGEEIPVKAVKRAGTLAAV